MKDLEIIFNINQLTDAIISCEISFLKKRLSTEIALYFETTIPALSTWLVTLDQVHRQHLVNTLANFMNVPTHRISLHFILASTFIALLDQQIHSRFQHFYHLVEQILSKEEFCFLIEQTGESIHTFYLLNFAIQEENIALVTLLHQHAMMSFEHLYQHIQEKFPADVIYRLVEKNLNQVQSFNLLTTTINVQDIEPMHFLVSQRGTRYEMLIVHATDNRNGQNILHQTLNHTEKFKFLLSNINCVKIQRQLLVQRDHLGQTSFEAAIIQGKASVVRYLLTFLNPNMINTLIQDALLDGNTPLHLAVDLYSNFLPFCLFLIEEKISIIHSLLSYNPLFICCKNNKGQTPLDSLLITLMEYIDVTKASMRPFQMTNSFLIRTPQTHTFYSVCLAFSEKKLSTFLFAPLALLCMAHHNVYSTVPELQLSAVLKHHWPEAKKVMEKIFTDYHDEILIATCYNQYLCATKSNLPFFSKAQKSDWLYSADPIIKQFIQFPSDTAEKLSLLKKMPLPLELITLIKMFFLADLWEEKGIDQVKDMVVSTISRDNYWSVLENLFNSLPLIKKLHYNTFYL